MNADSLVQAFMNVLSVVQHNPAPSAFAVIIILLVIQNILLGRRITRLTQGADGISLEGTIHTLGERADVLERYARSSSQKIKDIDERLQTSVRGVAVERFDPFQNAGGQQSFATALLNEHGDGIVLSGIHSRDGVRVYAKDVKGFKSERELSEEEQKAITQAQKNL